VNRHDGPVHASVPVVFVHGLFGPFADLAAFRQLGELECTAPDLDGYGAFAERRVSLDAQVRALREHLETRHASSPVHLVAHSIGGVYAFTVADRYPELVESVTTVEGNFSLADAFWSRSIAALGEGDAQRAITRRLDDPEGFLAADGVPVTDENLAREGEALAYQPWRTVWESAAAIVEATGRPDYDALLRRVFAVKPVYLVAGERSSDGWHVPDWARRAAASSTVVPGVGHMMMLERPEVFGLAIRRLLTDWPSPSRALRRADGAQEAGGVACGEHAGGDVVGDDEHRDRFGVELICRVLKPAVQGLLTSRGYRGATIGRPPSARRLWDELLVPQVARLHAENYSVYGRRKLHALMRRQGWNIGRDQTERLMRRAGVRGVRKSKREFATRPDKLAVLPSDLVNRRFTAPAPRRLWVCDVTYVATWSGFAYVAFVTDVYSRRIVGWNVAATLRSEILPMQALDMATWNVSGRLDGLIHHADHGSNYTAMVYAERIVDLGAVPSTGTVSDSLDNAMVEAVNNLYKAELIRQRGPWRTVEQVELATLEWV
jgi:transposase InsO family protein/pimeloyl-ACP methyl ester carboxylesterase